MATTIGVKMQMDGAAQFKADLQQITQKSKELAAEMKAAAAGADNQADKQRILAAQIDNARKKIDQLNKKYDAQKSAPIPVDDCMDCRNSSMLCPPLSNAHW